jgi:hypothetical protein
MFIICVFSQQTHSLAILRIFRDFSATFLNACVLPSVPAVYLIAQVPNLYGAKFSTGRSSESRWEWLVSILMGNPYPPIPCCYCELVPILCISWVLNLSISSFPSVLRADVTITAQELVYSPRQGKQPNVTMKVSPHQEDFSSTRTSGLP